MRSWFLCCSLAFLSASFVSEASAQVQSQSRRLAPGVLTTIPSMPLEGETYSGPLPLRKFPGKDFKPFYSPKESTPFEMAKSVTLRRPIWNLEFSFKPLRVVEVDIPQANGRLQRKMVWYMVYRIRNVGGALQPRENPDGTVSIDTVPNEAVDPLYMAQQFIPHFVLEAWRYDFEANRYVKQDYLNRVVPGALPEILDREILPPAKPMLTDQDGKPVMGPDGKPLILLNSAQIARVKIPPSTSTEDNSVWGVVTWIDVDQGGNKMDDIDFLKIYIEGLTNAFEYDTAQDDTRTFRQKTLQMNFWFPGDASGADEDKIYYGVPLVNDTLKQINLLRLYEIPGPSFTITETVTVTDTGQERLPLTRPFLTVPVQYDSQLEVAAIKSLDEDRKLPPELAAAMEKAGVPVASGAVEITSEAQGVVWKMKYVGGGQNRIFRITYDPQFWEIRNRGVEFLKRVEHLWTYR